MLSLSEKLDRGVIVSERGAGRTNQKTRTRKAIVDACRELIRGGRDVTMPEVARSALVSDATAYRYFPDLASLLSEATVGLWASPAHAMAPVAQSTDPIERVAFATEALLRGVLAYQGGVRAMISPTIVRPETAASRPGIRFGLIDYALAPFDTVRAARDPDVLTRLKRDLAAVVSPEALFSLTDQCGLSPDDAIASCVRIAKILTGAALCRELMARS